MLIRWILERLHRQEIYGRRYRELESLPDGILQDIGLTRSDLPVVDA